MNGGSRDDMLCEGGSWGQSTKLCAENQVRFGSAEPEYPLIFNFQGSHIPMQCLFPLAC